MDLSPWWGPFDVPHDKARRWHLGPLRLRVARLDYEWRVAWTIGVEPLETSLEIGAGGEVLPLLEAAEVRRFASPRLTETLELRVALADRPVVVRPETPFILLPKDEVTFYCTTPVWVGLWAEGVEQMLLEVPSFRPSDTWFGADTREGMLCYASRTCARLALEHVRWRPARATTAVKLKNRGVDALELVRFVLPAPQLAVYAGADGQLWTDTVVAEGDGQGELEVQVSPPTAGEAVRLAGPRNGPDRTALSRVFGALFG